MKKLLSFPAGVAVGVALAFSVWFFNSAKDPAVTIQQEQASTAPLPNAQPLEAMMEQEEPDKKPGSQVRSNTPVQAKDAQRQPQHKARSQTVSEVAEADMPSPDQDPNEAAANPAFTHDEQQFWNEKDAKTDDAWTSNSSEHISEFFTQSSQVEMASGSKLSDVECRATRCRVEVVHDNPKAQQDFAMKFAIGMSEQQVSGATMRSETTSDGHIVEVMYLSKK